MDDNKIPLAIVIFLIIVGAVVLVSVVGNKLLPAIESHSGTNDGSQLFDLVFIILAFIIVVVLVVGIAYCVSNYLF